MRERDTKAIITKKDELTKGGGESVFLFFYATPAALFFRSDPINDRTPLVNEPDREWRFALLAAVDDDVVLVEDGFVDGESGDDNTCDEEDVGEDTETEPLRLTGTPFDDDDTPFDTGAYDLGSGVVVFFIDACFSNSLSTFSISTT